MSARLIERIMGYEVEFIEPGHSSIKGTRFEVIARRCDPRWDLLDTETGRVICSAYGKRNTVTRFAQLMQAMAAGEEAINDTRD